MRKKYRITWTLPNGSIFVNRCIWAFDDDDCRKIASDFFEHAFTELRMMDCGFTFERQAFVSKAKLSYHLECVL
jgi:hypothetical protein